MANDTVEVKERQIPGRKVYELKDPVQQTAWEEISNSKTISQQNLTRLRSLGVEFRIESMDSNDKSYEPK